MESARGGEGTNRKGDDLNRSMKKLKLFIENFLVYGLGGIISSVIPLIMVPIITRIMPDSSYFGISDMSNTIISFSSALAVLGMYDAMYRMFFEKDDLEYKRTVCSTTLAFTTCMSIGVFALMLLLRRQLARWFLGDSALSYVIFLSATATLVSGTRSIIAAPTRMQNKRKDFTPDSVLLVFASTHYDPDEHIRDYNEFVKEIQAIN